MAVHVNTVAGRSSQDCAHGMLVVKTHLRDAPAAHIMAARRRPQVAGSAFIPDSTLGISRR